MQGEGSGIGGQEGRAKPWQGHNSGVNKLLFIGSQYGGACGGHLQHVVFPMFGNDLDIALGAWHRIEILIRLSTAGSSNDGILRWWLDGNLLGDHKTVNYPQCPWDVVAFSPSGGGVGDVKSETDFFSYDHAHLSKVGAPGTPPPTGPPSVTTTAPRPPRP